MRFFGFSHRKNKHTQNRIRNAPTKYRRQRADHQTSAAAGCDRRRALSRIYKNAEQEQRENQYLLKESLLTYLNNIYFSLFILVI